jgi:cytochrome P450
MRKAMRSFAFSGGTIIPKGTHVVVASLPMHLDEEFFPEASQFQPFRFSELRENRGEDQKCLLASTSSSYVSFGFGAHAWYAEHVQHAASCSPCSPFSSAPVVSSLPV